MVLCTPRRSRPAWAALPGVRVTPLLEGRALGLGVVADRVVVLDQAAVHGHVAAAGHLRDLPDRPLVDLVGMPQELGRQIPHRRTTSHSRAMSKPGTTQASRPQASRIALAWSAQRAAR